MKKKIIKEEWTKWKPIEGLAKKYSIDSAVWDETGFTIMLSDVEKKGKRVKVFFDTWVGAYQRVSTLFCDDLILELNQRHGIGFCDEWTFFKASNSEYMRWLAEESLEVSEDVSLKHFSFIAADSILDIAVNYEPIVEFIE